MPTKLGQNFLNNRAVIDKIIQAADLTPDDFVLEIGPGKGILTEELAKKAGKVIAIEIDNNLVEMLKNKFKNYRNVEIVEEDALKIKMQKSKCKMITAKAGSRLVGTNQNAKIEKIHNTLYITLDTDYKVVANLPYYITSPVIRMFLEAEFPPSEMILMVQKEVAERITAKPGKMSILAVAVQYYADAEILFNVGKENFDPVPEVDSCVIKINLHPNPLSRGEGDFDKKFFRVVRAGFCAKRKTLVNNLANSFHLSKKEAEEKLRAAGILPTARAQELSIYEWQSIASCL